MVLLSMPCYGCLLRPISPQSPITLSNTYSVACHAKILIKKSVSALLLLIAAQIPLLQLSRAQVVPPPPSENFTLVERPDFRIPVARPDAPQKGDYRIGAVTQES